MYQIKIFQANSTPELESQVNAWLAEKKTEVEINSLTPSSENGGTLTRLVVLYYIRETQGSMSF